MFNEKEDRQYLDEPNIYCLALEKYVYSKYYNDLNKENPTPEEVFLFSNEDQDAIYSQLSQKAKKRVLTVGSSGDQALNAIFHGADDVTLIDANLYSKYYTEYKIAAIKNLDFDAFNYYFISRRNNQIFSPDVFQKIFHDLSPDSQVFWGSLFLEHKSEDIFYNMVNLFSFPDKNAFYKNREDYKKLQEKLKDIKINYTNAEFNDFPKYAEGEYDLIMLSNIYDYVNQDDYVRVVNDLHDNNLSEGGQMQIRYTLSRIVNPKTFSKLFPDKHIKIYNIQDPFFYREYNSNCILTKPEPKKTANSNLDEMER